MARRQAFLEAARAVFMQQGFEAASINEVVHRAGGSLATLYSQFGSKEGLYLAVFEEQYARFLHDVAPVEPYQHLPLEQGLRVFGEQFVRASLDPEHLAFYRVVVGGAHAYPQLLQRYLVSGLARLRDALLEYLRTARASNGRMVGDPELAAHHFFDLMRSYHHYRALASVDYQLTPDELRAHVDGGVRVLLNGALQA
ncbi:MAG TPA: TetR/AcrR family transcriptional regulator [Caulobacterales bacterium]|nr:TetR/AcrR family transcriptional regulator [Caulobacterales bacterium]